MLNKPGALKTDKEQEKKSETNAPGKLKKEEAESSDAVSLPEDAPWKSSKDGSVSFLNGTDKTHVVQNKTEGEGVKGIIKSAVDSVGGVGGILKGAGDIANTLNIPVVGSVLKGVGSLIGGGTPVAKTESTSNKPGALKETKQTSSSAHASSSFKGAAGNYTLMPLMVPVLQN